MRQVLVQVPRGHGARVLQIAGDHEGTNLAAIAADGKEAPCDLVVVHVPNRRVEGLLNDLQGLPDLRVTLVPRGVLTLQPPAEEAAEQIRDVDERSPVEVFLAALQSTGSWRGFLGYAALAGAVVWVGMYTNTPYLLTAAMLLAPFASPAMNVAIATARGDAPLLGRGMLRYFAALAVTIAVAALLSLLLKLEQATPQMVQRSQVSSAAVLLPLAAGAAGALNLVQSERSNLVSGAAVGMLVAASLAPPAGLVGMASAIGRWDMVQSGIFVLLLQLVGINLSGALVFRLYGLAPRGARYDRGRSGVAVTAAVASIVGLIGLLSWQFATRPELQHASRASRAADEIGSVIDRSGLVHLVEADVRFTRPDVPGQNTLLGVIYVQRRAGVGESDQEIRSRLTRAIGERLRRRDFNVTPLMNIVVLEPAREVP